MANVKLKGSDIRTVGELPKVGSQAPDFTLVKPDLSEFGLGDYRGNRVILNIFPSVDTAICATSVRKFNQQAADIDNTRVICISADLPFAAGRFCGAEGIEQVTMGSSFRSDFGKTYGVAFADGPLRGLLARAVVVLDEEGVVLYRQQVVETTEEPDYEAALASVR